MTATIAGLPHWEITFDADGDPDASQRQTLLDEASAHQVTDLFLFSHGWNNSVTGARQLYQGWFSLLPPLLPAAVGPAARTVGTVGVFWPSMQWSDEAIPDFSPAPGAAAGLLPSSAPDGPRADARTIAALKQVYRLPQQRTAIERMFTLLAERPSDDAAITEFHALMAELAPPAGSLPAEDRGAQSMLAESPHELFARFADALETTAPTTVPSGGGAAGLGDMFGRLWDGAKEAMRQLTYFQMKSRAGTVGQHGLGPLLGALGQARPGVRAHLVGHSFGARLVSFALAGLPAGPSPVGSVTLLEGAFSHFAFADHLPPPMTGPGGLAGAQARVAGPLVSCFSSHDSALGTFYALAAAGSGSNAAGLEAAAFAWGAIGFDGAQLVDATTVPVQQVGSRYEFAPQRLNNVDCSRVVCTGDSPAGAHSDIVHPELAWVALAAAGLVVP